MSGSPLEERQALPLWHHSKTYIHLAILAILAIVLYGRTVSYDFAYDDVLQIVHNPAVTADPGKGLNVAEVIKTPTPPGNLYRPLTTLTYRATFLFTGLSKKALHLKNVALYVLCCALFYIFCLQLTSRNTSIAFAASALFVLHPTHVEVVANIIGRAEMLALLFGLLSLLTCSSYSKSKIPALSMLLSVVSFFFACLSKESALTLLALIPLYPLFLENSKRAASRIWVLALALILTSLLVLLLRYQALGDSFRILSDGHTIYPENPIFHLSFIERLIPSLKVMGDYIAQTILPLRLSADYSMMPEPFLASVYSSSGLLLAALPVLLLIAIYFSRTKSYVFAGIWFFIGFGLTCNILTPIGTIRADRLLFLPGAGLILFLTCVVADTLHSSRYSLIRRSLPILICLGFFARSWVRIPVWESNAVLFPRTILDAPNSPKAHYNMAVEHFRKNRLHDSLKEVSTALALHPKYLFAARLHADIARRMGDVEMLEHAYRKILEIEPGDETVQKYLLILEQRKAGNRTQ